MPAERRPPGGLPLGSRPAKGSDMPAPGRAPVCGGGGGGRCSSHAFRWCLPVVPRPVGGPGKRRRGAGRGVARGLWLSQMAPEGPPLFERRRGGREVPSQTQPEAGLGKGRFCGECDWRNHSPRSKRRGGGDWPLEPREPVVFAALYTDGSPTPTGGFLRRGRCSPGSQPGSKKTLFAKSRQGPSWPGPEASLLRT